MQELNCNQVVTLLTFFIEGKLSRKLSANVEHHLNTCPNCREKYIKLRKILENYAGIKNKINEEEIIIDEEEFKTPQYQIFKDNLSAYIDNELSDDDNIKIKKIAIANPLARKDLENIYSFKQLLQSSFNRTKSSMKQDYTRKTLSQLSINTEAEPEEWLNKIIMAFACLMIFILFGIINFLNF